MQESHFLHNFFASHCYDPNEERRLRAVIKAVGEEQFTARVRLLTRTSA